MGKRGPKDRGLSKEYIHTTILLTKEEWDRLNYLADGVGKTVSRYIVDEILNNADKKPNTERAKEEKFRHSLCFRESEKKEIERLAEKNNLPMSKYLVGMLLGDNNAK